MRNARNFLATIIAAVALVMALPAWAQADLDSTKADPKNHKVVFENDQVRVVHYLIAPGVTTARHSHPASVGVSLTDGTATSTTDDGKTTNVQAKAGAAAWRTPVTHVFKNTGNTPIEGILVEPKKPHSARPAGSADPTTFPNPTDKLEFENDQVRIVRFHIEPGQKNEMHGHPDNVQILLTDAQAKVTTADGKTATAQGKKGDVKWRPATVHSVQNIGDKPFDGILVEMKGGGPGTGTGK